MVTDIIKDLNDIEEGIIKFLSTYSFSSIMKEEVLESIGLSRNEAKVFVALLQIGPSSVGNISQESKIHRTNVYDALDRLTKKGLVSYFMDGNDSKVFEASNPDNLMGIINEKRVLLEKILPSLKIQKEMTEKKSQAHVYEGITAFTRILDGFLNYKEPILVYGIPKKAPEYMKHFIPGFHNRRIPKKIKMLHIYNHNAIERIKYLNSLLHTEARFLPQQLDSEVSTNICGDEVVFTVWSDPIMTIQINNNKVAESYKKYFYLLWNEAK
ncbi:MAG: helix-turn-helix domain-containing protein [Candidatus Woesearchaeota archaeon]